MKLTIYIKKFKVEEIVSQNKIFSNLDWDEGESFILKSGDNKCLMVETSTNFSWVSSRLKFYEINKIDGNFNCTTTPDDLYSYVRLEEINKLKDDSGMKRIQIIGVDGATDYIRPYVNQLTVEDFEIYKKYQLSICERPELLGASSHIMDILQK